MKYVDQSHKDLRLYLLSDKPDTDVFTLISRSNFVEGPYKIDFGILAESHYATVTVEDDAFTEVCACVDIPLPDTKAVFLTEIGDANKGFETENLSYTFNHKATNMSVGEVKLTALQSKRSHPYSYYLEHLFPPAKPGEETPVTEIYVTINGGVLIETVHTYPNHDAMVFTTSYLSRKK